MKVLFLDDGYMTKEDLFKPENARALRIFDSMDVTFAKDTNVQKWEKTAEYILKIEKEGPEGWIIPDSEVLKEIEDADFLFVNVSGVTEEMMQHAKKLKAIFLLRSGTEGINLKAAEKLGIPVCNCPSRLAQPVADMAIGLMLSECRGIARGNLRATNGIWQQMDCYDDFSNAPLGNLTVGLIGFGGIARALAKRLVCGFGSEVLAFDPYVDSDVMKACGVEKKDTLNDLLKDSDIVSVHMKVTEETKGMIGKAEFDIMKPNAIFINTARASLVDENALIEALREKKIRGAGLDVYASEPLAQDSELIHMQNTTLMPHRAGATSNITLNSLRLLLPEFQRFLNGEKLLFRVV